MLICNYFQFFIFLSSICILLNICTSSKYLQFFQIFVLFLIICTFFNDLCFFQISALFSMICAFFNDLCFFQISALLSNICTSFRFLHFFAIIRVYPRKKTAGSQNHPAAVKLFFNFPLFMPLSSSNHLTQSDICSRTSRKYPPYDGMS